MDVTNFCMVTPNVNKALALLNTQGGLISLVCVLTCVLRGLIKRIKELVEALKYLS